MPRLPKARPIDEMTEGDGSFDSHFTEGARTLLASLDAYVASHPEIPTGEKKPMAQDGVTRDLPQMKLG
jgi:hypothetical protein